MLSDYDKGLFTPDCLVGVETNYGYVTSVLSISFGSTEYLKPSLYVYTTESLSKEDLIDVHTLKYYISDETDETVSFIWYVEMFYDGVAWWMKSSLRRKKLDKVFCIRMMNYYEHAAYHLISEDKSLNKVDTESTQITTLVDKFIEDCIAADIILREHLYYPK